MGDLASLATLLHLTGFLRLFDLLDITARRRLACVFIARALERDAEVEGRCQRITTEADLEAFFGVAGVLVEADPVADDSSALAEEHSLLASIAHLIGEKDKKGDSDITLVLLTKMRKRYATGGAAVVRATFPALVLEVGTLSLHKLAILPSIEK